MYILSANHTANGASSIYPLLAIQLMSQPSTVQYCYEGYGKRRPNQGFPEQYSWGLAQGWCIMIPLMMRMMMHRDSDACTCSARSARGACACISLDPCASIPCPGWLSTVQYPYALYGESRPNQACIQQGLWILAHACDGLFYLYMLLDSDAG